MKKTTEMVKRHKAELIKEFIEPHLPYEWDGESEGILIFGSSPENPKIRVGSLVKTEHGYLLTPLNRDGSFTIPSLSHGIDLGYLTYDTIREMADGFAELED